MVLPKLDGDYYGDNNLFSEALAMYGNSVDLFLREALGNKIEASSPTNEVEETYPLRVTTVDNTAMVIVNGGKSYIPIVFKGLSEVNDPKLWKADENCWELVDQSNWGKDFWQVDYQSETATFDLVYNINQDKAQDERANIKYYLGEEAPTYAIVPQSKLNEDVWTSATSLSILLGSQVSFSPQISELDIVSNGEGAWSWSGPNGFVANTRELNLENITENELGIYSLSYTDPFACTVTLDWELTCIDTNEDGNCDEAGPCGDFDNAAILLNQSHTESEVFKTVSIIESSATMASNITVNYEAGDYILLTEGFYADPNSIFTANIIDCSTSLKLPKPIVQAKEAVLAKKEKRTKNISLIAYPNPFSNIVNIAYELETETSL